MSPDSSDNSPEQPERTFEWVGRDTFAVTPLYRLGWQILKRDWLVFVWKLLADMFARLSTPLLGLFVVMLFLVDFQVFVDQGFSPLLWAERAADIARSPNFITGALGAVFFVSLFATAVQAVVHAGIWGVLRDGLRDEPVQLGASFFRRALEWFAPVMLLFLVRFALRVVTAMLGAAMLIGVAQAIATGELARLANWQITLFVATGATFYVTWAALTRLAVEVAAAPLVLDDAPLGEALLRGARLVIDHFWEVYRILIFALGMLLIPLGICWVLVIASNAALLAPGLEPLAGVMQLSGQLLVFVSFSVVWVLFYGALFAFYDHSDRRIETTGLPGEWFGDAAADDDGDDGEDPEQPSPGSYERDTTIDELTPDEAPTRFSFEDVLDDASDDDSAPDSEDSSGNGDTTVDDDSSARD